MGIFALWLERAIYGWKFFNRDIRELPPLHLSLSRSTIIVIYGKCYLNGTLMMNGNDSRINILDVRRFVTTFANDIASKYMEQTCRRKETSTMFEIFFELSLKTVNNCETFLFVEFMRSIITYTYSYDSISNNNQDNLFK